MKISVSRHIIFRFWGDVVGIFQITGFRIHGTKFRHVECKSSPCILT